MAGSYSANGNGLGAGAYLYARVEATVVDTNATTCTVTVNAIVVSDTGSSSFIRGRATSNSSGGYGSWSDYKSVSYGGRTTCATQTFTVARGDSAKTMNVHANLEGGGTGMYAGTSDTATVAIAIPAIPYETPNAPSGCSATRASKTSATISWTNGATTTTKNRTAVILERRTDSGAFSQIASLGANSTSYTDTLIAADHTYVYRVKSRGKGGDSGYATSGTVPLSYEAPNAPTNCKATRNSGARATVTWTNGATTTLKTRTAVLLERKTDSGGFSQIASLSAGATSYTDNSIAADHSYTYRVRSQGNGGYSGYATSSAIPLAYEAPNAPSGCSASRASDTKATVSWTNGSTTTLKTRTAVLIERAVDGGGFAQISSLGASVSNYTDNSISANHRYAYRVRSQGNGGYSGYATSGYIYTTPAAPTAVSVEKTAATTLRITATVNTPYATGYDVAITYNSGSTWTTLASNTSLPYTTTVSGGTVRIRVRSVRGSLASAWKESSDVLTVTAPLAPTITARPATVIVPNTDATIAWTINHPDGTAQSAAQVEYTLANGTTSTVDLTTQKTWTLSASYMAQTGAYSARVRTKGLSDDWGAWSGYVTWSVRERPAVYFTSPASDGATFDGYPLLFEWSITDETGVASQTFTVTDGTKSITRQLGTDARSISLEVSDILFDTGAECTATLNVTGGSSLTSTAVREFGTDWLLPAEPEADFEELEGHAVSVTVRAGAGSGIADTEYLTLIRVLGDGTAWAIADRMQDGETALDPLPPLNEAYSYVVTATSETGATSQSTFEREMQSGDDWVLNFGQSAELSLTLRYGPSGSRSLTHGGALYHFARGGRGLPVWYGTRDRDEGNSYSFKAIGKDDADRLFELSYEHPVGWLRDQYGHRWRGHIAPSVSYNSGMVFSIDVTLDATQFREAW